MQRTTGLADTNEDGKRLYHREQLLNLLDEWMDEGYHAPFTSSEVADELLWPRDKTLPQLREVAQSDEHEVKTMRVGSGRVFWLPCPCGESRSDMEGE